MSVLGGAGWVCEWGVNGDYVCPINARWPLDGLVWWAWAADEVGVPGEKGR